MNLMIREILHRYWRRCGLFVAVISLMNTIFLAGRWRSFRNAVTLISLAFVLASFYGFLHARRSNHYDKRLDDHA